MLSSLAARVGCVTVHAHAINAVHAAVHTLIVFSMRSMNRDAHRASPALSFVTFEPDASQKKFQAPALADPLDVCPFASCKSSCASDPNQLTIEVLVCEFPDACWVKPGGTHTPNEVVVGMQFWFYWPAEFPPRSSCSCKRCPSLKKNPP